MRAWRQLPGGAQRWCGRALAWVTKKKAGDDAQTQRRRPASTVVGEAPICSSSHQHGRASQLCSYSVLANCSARIRGHLARWVVGTRSHRSQRTEGGIRGNRGVQSCVKNMFTRLVTLSALFHIGSSTESRRVVAGFRPSCCVRYTFPSSDCHFCL